MAKLYSSFLYSRTVEDGTPPTDSTVQPGHGIDEVQKSFALRYAI
jgi:hypothetical protein